MTGKVFIVLQDNEEARPIIEAILEDNKHATIDYQPAMVRIEAVGRLEINRERVEEHKGSDWDTQELQLVMISIAGNVDEDDDHFILEWNK